MIRTVLDFETRSAANLKKTGPYVYAKHPTTRPTCMAVKVGENPTRLLTFDCFSKPWKELSVPFRADWFDIIRESLVVAHNAFFERCIYQHVLVDRLGWPSIPVDRWRCTAAKAATHALPRGLAGAGEVLGLSTQKDKGGMIAMMRTCQPSREWNAWKKKTLFAQSKSQLKRITAQIPEPPMFLEPTTHPEVFEELYRYCRIDVETEYLLDQQLADLTESELEIWQINQELNWRGFRVDLPAVRKIVEILQAEEKVKLRELDELTMGLITKPGARAAILDFLALEGIVLPDIKANTVQDALEGGKLSPVGKQLLELRKVLSKTSTRKYQGFIERSDPEDHRVRDILMYHGASTGRDSGTGIQIQNFPRPVIEMDRDAPYAPVHDARFLDVDTLKLLYGDNLSLLFSSILRNMIIASKGMELFVADFSKIEVAVGWWLAGNKPGIKILRLGGDPYKRLAAMNTGKLYEDIEDDGLERQLAKHQILGCQYGMGWEKFQRTGAELHRLALSDEQSKLAVKQYRETFPAVTAFWREIERAGIAAVRNPGQVVTFSHGGFIVEKDFLWMILPSGRRIAYHKPRVSWRVNEYNGEDQEQLEFWGVNSRTKKWAIERTWGGVLFENMTQAVSRDLLMRAVIAVRKAGYHVLLTVHDEIVAERKRGEGSLDKFIDLICAPPEWGDRDLLLEAKGYVNPRYRK